MDLQSGQQLVLASASPRRLQIFNSAGFQVKVEPASVDETIPPETDPVTAVRTLALSKAATIAERYPERVVIGADTIVFHQDQILEKPLNPDHACEMLQQLQGDWHTVFTGFAIIKLQDDIRLAQVEETRVKFVPQTVDQIRRYVASGEPMDKAGAYGIQERGALMVEKIEGCYFNVMGFPIAAFYREFKQLFADT